LKPFSRNIPILLVTDQIPSAHGMGVSKTMYNLLEGYPPSLLYILAEPNEKANQLQQLKGVIIRRHLYYIPLLKGRLGALGYNKAVKNLNGWLGRILPIRMLNDFEGRVKPSLVLVATTGFNRVYLAKKLATALQLPLLPYFLDNWMMNAKGSYGGLNKQKMIRQVLAEANGWMVISENLKLQLEEQYRLKAPAFLVIHSPAKPFPQQLQNVKKTSGDFVIRYAGSLWDMHFDALLLVAKVLQKLRNEGMGCSLIIHTPVGHWQHRKNILEPLGVIYGGYVQDNHELLSYFQQSDLLLVTAAFHPGQKIISASSLQTKVTEYMGSGVPILSVGPDYGVCNLFFKQHQCAFVINHPSEENAVLQVRHILQAANERATLAGKAFQLAATTFSQAFVQQKMEEFLLQTIGKEK